MGESEASIMRRCSYCCDPDSGVCRPTLAKALAIAEGRKVLNSHLISRTLDAARLTPAAGVVRERRSPAQRLAGSTRYFSKSVTPSPARNVSSIRKWPVKLARRLVKDRVGGIGHDLGRARHRIIASPPSRFLIAAVAMVVRGHSALTAMPSASKLAGKPQRAQAHAELGDASRPTCGRTTSPSCRAAATASGCAGSPPFADAGWRFRDQESAARVDAVHQVVALHVGLRRSASARWRWRC